MTGLKKAITPDTTMIAAVQPVNYTPKIIAPDAITNVEAMLNLNGTDKPITKAFSFLKHTDDASSPYVPNPETYNSVVSMNVADQNGNDHVFSMYFAKTAVANEWNVYVFIDGRNIDTVTNFPTVNNDSLPPLDLSALSAIDLSNSFPVTTLSPIDEVNFFSMRPLIYQGANQLPETVNNTVLPPSDLSGATGLYFPNEFSPASSALIFQGSAPAAEERSMYFSLSGGVISSVVLGEGEITANPLKISFDDKGQLVNVDDVDMVKGFRTKAPSAEELAKYAMTHEPISTIDEPFTTASVLFDHLDLSAINPDLKDPYLNIGVNFANSTQFATPFTVNDLKQTWGLNGTAENDTLSGSVGNDWIIGEMGADKMTGGMGADQFSFHNIEEMGLTAKTRDIITDFKHSEGDKIDLYDIDANSADVDSFGFQVDQSFTFIDSKAFSKTDATGQLRFDSKTHILHGSTDVDSSPEFSIQLNGVNSLIASDFIL